MADVKNAEFSFEIDDPNESHSALTNTFNSGNHAPKDMKTSGILGQNSGVERTLTNGEFCITHFQPLGMNMNSLM